MKSSYFHYLLEIFNKVRRQKCLRRLLLMMLLFDFFVVGRSILKDVDGFNKSSDIEQVMGIIPFKKQKVGRIYVTIIFKEI